MYHANRQAQANNSAPSLIGIYIVRYNWDPPDRTHTIIFQTIKYSSPNATVAAVTCTITKKCQNPNSSTSQRVSRMTKSHMGHLLGVWKVAASTVAGLRSVVYVYTNDIASTDKEQELEFRACTRARALQFTQIHTDQLYACLSVNLGFRCGRSTSERFRRFGNYPLVRETCPMKMIISKIITPKKPEK